MINQVKENGKIFDFQLSDDNMTKIETLNHGKRRYIRTEEALKGFAIFKPVFEKE